MTQLVDVSWHERVALLTLNRPDKRNALTIELCEQLRDAARAALIAGARALVLTGEGSSFCSGADLDSVYTAEFREALYEMLHTVVDAPVTVIAAVNGPAIGAGTQVAIAADLRVAAPGAVFAVPTARIGLAVDPWTIRRLALLAGNGVARRMLLACEQLSASEAVAGGLADRAGTLADALDWAAGLTELAPLTVAYSKQVLNQVFEPELDPLADKELFDAFEGCWASEDFAEGRLAREEKRPPRFQGH
ncbi:MAG TPA: enoyl-CoA hydratase [Pseudonocardia sp.]|uniref:enoyl-CoA hydratase n=1 Tax=Pseudonocardia sp. TaxID=60912 RepID=UPI002CE8C7EA|nr:enoyl-CoA hydratase [Pseudonocardia sp.]HTF50698.1 enoyl-CoA hydratase [Pseudonocardia sp.]